MVLTLTRGPTVDQLEKGAKRERKSTPRDGSIGPTNTSTLEMMQTRSNKTPPRANKRDTHEQSWRTVESAKRMCRRVNRAHALEVEAAMHTNVSSIPSHGLICPDEASDDEPMLLSASEQAMLLRDFDLKSKFGPCLGLSRKARWLRAQHHSLEPPKLVMSVLDLIDADDPAQQSFLAQSYSWLA